MSGALAAAGWRACKIRPEAMTPSRAVGPRLSATGGRDACWSASTIPRFRGDQAPQLSASSLAGMSAVAGRQHCAESCHSRDRNRAARFDPKQLLASIDCNASPCPIADARLAKSECLLLGMKRRIDPARLFHMLTLR